MARLTPAVVRTLDILELFLRGSASLSAAEVVRLTGLPRSTVHELLTTLTSRDYLQKNEESGRFTLGVTLLHLGNAYSERFDLLGAANLAARALSERLAETASVAIRQGAAVFYLARVERRAVLAIPSGIGQRLPASCTAIGKALLSAVPDDMLTAMYPDPTSLPVMTQRSITTLPDLIADLNVARQRGYALENGESTPGLRCLAKLVYDGDRNAAAAISVSVPEARWERRSEEDWAAEVEQAATGLSAQLGYRG
ncbi:MAG: IclR family transcriptional regulator [Arachnia sp.]